MQRDHPRVCGENCPAWKERLLKMGSPPRVRGKLCLHPCLHCESGITPACAGKTPASRGAPGLSWDHPRVCGENMVLCVYTRSPVGSPPRVRGKLPRDYLQKSATGITPACAGKTKYENGATVNTRDHPRVCGENFTPLPFPMMVVGSPPRVRGKRSTFPYKKTVAGITPACAGKTRSATG